MSSYGERIRRRTQAQAVSHTKQAKSALSLHARLAFEARKYSVCTYNVVDTHGRVYAQICIASRCNDALVDFTVKLILVQTNSVKNHE